MKLIWVRKVLSCSTDNSTRLSLMEANEPKGTGLERNMRTAGNDDGEEQHLNPFLEVEAAPSASLTVQSRLVIYCFACGCSACIVVHVGCPCLCDPPA
jgi:hypothetical protein